MIATRVLGAAAAILVGSVSALGGCASNDATAPTVVTAKDVQAASVTLTVHNDAGDNVASGSGVLIAPRLVLTSAHLVAGMSRWTVLSADGRSKVNGIRGISYDWMNYDGSSKSHPRKHDVAVIYLDAPIELAVYPHVSSDELPSGGAGTRLRSNGLAFQSIPATFTHVNDSPHAYVTSFPATETVEAGDAVLNDNNEIIGLVTGKGLTTNQLYVARTNDLATWLAPKAVCGGSAGSLGVRTYVPPPPKPGCDTPGNGSSSSSSSGSTPGTPGVSSSSSSGSTPGTPGTSSSSSGNNASSSSSGNVPGGHDNPGCNDGGGYCSGNCSGVPSNGGSSGSNPTSPGGPTNPGGPSTSSSSSSGDNPGGPTTSSSSSSGENPSGPTTGSTTGTSGSSGPGSTKPTGDDEGEVCEGPSDNPETCPVEPNGCEGTGCGGGGPDQNVDYGACDACSADPGGIIVR